MQFVIGDYNIDPEARTLTRAGREVEVEPKTLDVLLYLIRNRDRVVPRPELLADLWPGTRVTEAAVYQAIAAARRALGDDGRRQERIRTFYGAGIRFVAEVVVTGALATPDASEGEAVAVPFVGRADVLERLAAGVSQAVAGDGGVMMLRGEPGVGKTRTVIEVARLARARGVRTLWARGSRDEGAPVFWPWLQLLRGVAAAGPDGLTQRAERLAAELVPEPADASEPTTFADPAPLRFRLFDAVTGLLGEAAAREPLIVALDDLQWFDPSSLRLLRFAAVHWAERRLAVLCTARTWESGAREDVAATLADLGRVPRYMELSLAGLDAADTLTLAQHVAGRELAASLSRSVHARTSGNPLFTEETVRHWLAAGAADDPVAAERVAAARLPENVLRTIRERMRGLAPVERRLLTLAAVVGREFRSERVAALAGGDAAEVGRALRAGESSGVVESDRADPGALHFVHDLFQEALYDELDPDERHRLHARVAEDLANRERDGGSAARAIEIARHRLAALPLYDPEDVADDLVAAARSAAGQNAWQQEAELLRDALRVVPERARHEALRAELWIAFAEACLRAGDRDPARDALERAAEIARRRDDAPLLARAALAMGASGLGVNSPMGSEESQLAALSEAIEAWEACRPESSDPLRTRLHARLAVVSHTANRFEAALERAEVAVSLAASSCDPDVRAQAWAALSLAGSGPDTLGRGVEAAHAMVAAASEGRSREYALMCRLIRLHALLVEGRVGDGFTELSALEAEVGASGQPALAWWLEASRFTFAMLAGQRQAARAQIEPVFELATRIGDGTAEPVRMGQYFQLAVQAGELEPLADLFHRAVIDLPQIGLMRAGEIYLDATIGEVERARSRLAELASEDYRALPRDSSWTSSLAYLVLAVERIGDAERARDLRARLHPLARWHVAYGFPVLLYMGPIARYLGVASLTAGDVDEAVRWLETALHSLADTPALAHVTYARADLAEALLARDGPGDRERGEGMRKRAAQDAAALDMGALSARLAAARPSATPRHGGLRLIRP